MFENITPEYKNFIKKFLINRCYIDYSAKVNSITTDEEEYNENLSRYKCNESIWEEVFSKNHTLFKYLIYMTKHPNKDFSYWPSVLYQQKQANVYKQKSFQEFIDELVNLKKVGAFDYQQFIKSMNDINFKQNFVEKYNQYDMEITIKNHIIYVVQLYLSEKTEKSYYFTDEELETIDTSLNVIPYFEYLSMTREKAETPDQSEKTQRKENINETYLKNLEDAALKIVGEYLHI